MAFQAIRQVVQQAPQTCARQDQLEKKPTSKGMKTLIRIIIRCVFVFICMVIAVTLIAKLVGLKTMQIEIMRPWSTIFKEDIDKIFLLGGIGVVAYLYGLYYDNEKNNG
ncbi:MAG: hypothetical protein LBN27_02570 [Prevotellaceae bacterium]|nr:hypothetical protein [Prevotellaceae bacterium]